MKTLSFKNLCAIVTTLCWLKEVTWQKSFVRIVRVVPKEVVPEKEPTAMELVQHLAQKRMITAREAKLLQFILNIIDTDEEQKKVILQQAIGQMTGSSQG